MGRKGKQEGRVSGTIMVFRPDLLDTKIPPERKKGEREKIYPANIQEKIYVDRCRV